MLLLASASPARSRLLHQAGIPHRVQVSGFDEESIACADPVELVARLARAKVEAVLWDRPGREPAEEGEIKGILGCDSVLVFEGEIFGKPRDAAEAAGRWRRMAGRWGELHTGHCLLRPSAASAADPGILEARQEETVTTRVCFAPLAPSEIDAYVATGEPLACAGGFALEGRGGLLVERIEGCFSNVIGLSLPLLRRWLSGTVPPEDR